MTSKNNLTPRVCGMRVILRYAGYFKVASKELSVLATARTCLVLACHYAQLSYHCKCEISVLVIFLLGLITSLVVLKMDSQQQCQPSTPSLILTYFKGRNFRGRNFRDFAIFCQIRESLFPRNIRYIQIAKVFSRKIMSFRLAKVNKP